MSGTRSDAARGEQYSLIRDRCVRIMPTIAAWEAGGRCGAARTRAFAGALRPGPGARGSTAGRTRSGLLILQARRAGGRLPHAMRSIGVAQRAVEMMSRRARSHFTQASALAENQLVQQFIADSDTELMPFRLAVLHAAWLIETDGKHAARAEIGACKIPASQVLKSIGLRAIQVHGALGVTSRRWSMCSLAGWH